jgi:dephospho-CoA kinase
MKKIGITGTIASGKTSVSLLLRHHGMPVFNADGCSRMSLHRGNVCYEPLVRILGQDALDSNLDIDPHAMADIIFGNEDKRKAVNAIVHPFVRESLHRFFHTQAEQELVFAEVPLLFEAHWENEFDMICTVSCSKQTAVERMMRDRGYTEQEAEQRYRAAVNEDVQKQKADTVIVNDGDRRELERQVNQWLRELRKECRHGDQR